ncbi:M10 family metallopeptidase C-terminal domain-containing protein [Ascidiaceihabitans sp.]|uniref:M10 family metallopeptidase C-terminal domain-containing protein n=1 Tax=Ascidiaceihabitans sp. TaxID=1872644 RepID=UPI003297FAE3
MTLRIISTSQVNTSVGGEIVNNLGSPNFTVASGDEVVVFDNVTLAADGSLVDVSNLDDFDMVMNGDGFAGSNAFRMDYQSNLGTYDFEISLNIGDEATITSNVNLGFFGVLSSGLSLLQDGSEFRFDNAGTAKALQGRGFEMQSIAEVQASNSGTVTAGQGPAFLFENIMFADFINTGTAINTANSPTGVGSHLGAAVAFNSQVLNVQFTNTGTVSGNVLSLVSEATTSENIVNAGTLSGDVFTSFFTNAISEFTNSGQILGMLDTRNGDDVVNNTGLITGDVELGENDDFFSNAGGGTVAGVINGDMGNDTIIGGTGADEIDGGDDADLIYGADGSDLIMGGVGEDTIYGDAGGDDLSGNEGIDIIYGGADSDTLSGGDDNDFLFGGIGDDSLNGNNNDDLLRGDAGDDTLSGGGGGDRLFGGSGDDLIIGGAGRDVMRGEAGADTFVYTSATDSTTAAADRIRDFETGLDRIDLSEVEDFVFVGDNAFSGTGAEVRFQTTSSGLRFEMDVDGNGTVDMRVNMNNVSTMTVDDFIL